MQLRDLSTTIYGCFRADGRISMDVYANSVHAALSEQGVDSNLFTPEHRLERWDDSRIVMRYLRYISYARQVKRVQAGSDIHHVADHGYAHLLPSLPKALRAITVHDLIPYLTWKGEIPISGGAYVSAVAKPRLNLYSLKFIKDFDRIIAVSESTAADIQTVLSISRSKISVVPPIIADYFQPQSSVDADAYRRRLTSSESTKLVLITGREYYKNHATALRVVKRLIEEGHNIKLLRCGLHDSAFNELVAAHGMVDYTESIFVPRHEELPLLYAAVDCLLFPSWYEGFGMPVAEALACGTCVVSSDSASLPEVGGTLSMRSAAGDLEGLASQLEQCLFDPALQQRVSSNGPQWVEQFRAHSVARQLQDIYDGGS